MIKRQGGKAVLVSKKTGKVLGRHDTVAEAKAQERAIQISKHKKRGK